MDYYLSCTYQAVPSDDKDRDVPVLVHTYRGLEMTHRPDLLKGSPMPKSSMRMTVILF